MCLIAQSREPKIAEEDIVCYKLVKYWEDADVYVSPPAALSYSFF